MWRFFGRNGEQCNGRRRSRQRRDPQQLDARGSARAASPAIRRPDAPRAIRPPPALRPERRAGLDAAVDQDRRLPGGLRLLPARSEEHTSELQSQSNLVCRLLLEKKKKKTIYDNSHHT